MESITPTFTRICSASPLSACQSHRSQCLRLQCCALPNPRSVVPQYDTALGQSSGTLQIGVWASGLIQITAPWSVTTGLRMSDESGFNNLVYRIYGQVLVIPNPPYAYVDKATPYIGTMFSLTSHYSLYASYADIYYSNNGVASINYRLPPGDGVNIEAGLKGSWGGGALTGSLALYSITQRGIATVDFEPNRQPGQYEPYTTTAATTRTAATRVKAWTWSSREVFYRGGCSRRAIRSTTTRDLVPDLSYGAAFVDADTATPAESLDQPAAPGSLASLVRGIDGAGPEPQLCRWTVLSAPKIWPGNLPRRLSALPRSAVLIRRRQPQNRLPDQLEVAARGQRE